MSLTPWTTLITASHLFLGATLETFGGGFVIHEKSKARRQRFQDQLQAEGLKLGGFGSTAVAHARLDVHLHILERCRAKKATYCLIMEDFVHWKPGKLTESLQQIIALPEFDHQLRCGTSHPLYQCSFDLICPETKAILLLAVLWDCNPHDPL